MTTRTEAAKKLYGGNDDYAHPVVSYSSRHEARLKARNDKENLKRWEEARGKIPAFAKKHGISSQALHTMLTTLLEREQYPLSQETLEKQRPVTKEALSQEFGGAEAKDRFLNRYIAVTTDLAKELPYLAELANKTGAGEDLRIIRALGQYGEPAAQENQS